MKVTRAFNAVQEVRSWLGYGQEEGDRHGQCQCGAQGESEAVPPEGAQFGEMWEVENAGGGQLQQHAELGGGEHDLDLCGVVCAFSQY